MEWSEVHILERTLYHEEKKGSIGVYRMERGSCLLMLTGRICVNEETSQGFYIAELCMVSEELKIAQSRLEKHTSFENMLVSFEKGPFYAFGEIVQEVKQTLHSESVRTS